MALNNPLSIFEKADVSTSTKILREKKWLACTNFTVSSEGTSCRSIIKVNSNCMAYYESMGDTQPQGLLTFAFHIKFQTLQSIQKPNCFQGIRISNEITKKTVDLLHENVEVLREWKEILIKRINRKGFSQYFKTTMKIGKGSFASVRLAFSLENDYRVAIKSYDFGSSDQIRRQGIMNQITVLRSLNHPNINKLYGVYQDGSIWHVVLQLFDGGQLAYKFQSRYRFSSREIKIIMKSLVLGLEHMHSKNIFHRDLKPENIMLRTKEPQSDVVIVDLGLSVDVNNRNNPYFRCGTPGYMPPEILKSTSSKKKLDPIGDMFSLGLVFHLLLTGQSIFTAKVYEDVLAQNKQCNFDLDNAYYSIFTRATVDLLKKLLDTNPLSRISAQQALGHPFFTQCDIIRSNRISFIAPTFISSKLFDCYSQESVADLAETILHKRKCHSKSRQKQSYYRYRQIVAKDKN